MRSTIPGILKMQKAFSRASPALHIHLGEGFDSQAAARAQPERRQHRSSGCVSLAGEYGLSYATAPHRWTNSFTYELR